MDKEEKMISDEIKKLTPVLGRDTAIRLSNAYLLGDENVRKRIFELIDVVKAAVFSNSELRDGILMEPPLKEDVSIGDIELGRVLYGKKKLYPFFLNEDLLLTHIGIFGSSGYGKTNIAYILIENLAKKEIPVLVFDFSKRNYRDLLSTHLKDKVDIYTIGREPSPLKFNPLKPPDGIQLSQWMKEFSSIFDHAYWLLGGGRHIILKALEAVHEMKEHPKLIDIKRWINEYAEASLPQRERNWIATAERPLESLCFKEIGEVFDCKVGTKPSEFFKKGRITILELDALDTNDKTFFIEIILQWIRDWLLVKNQREKLVGVVILEEAHHVLNREKSKKLGTETVIDLIFREVRELGLGMVYIDQHPSMVSYPALGNTSTHIYMNLGLDTKHSSDVLDATNMLGLDYEEQKSYLRKLPVGHGFVLCRRLDFHEPFLVEFHGFDLKKGSITDEDIEKLRRTKVAEFIEENIEKSTKDKEISTETDTNIIDEIGEKEWEIIETIGHGRGAFTSQIYSSLGISGATFNKKIKKLIRCGVVGQFKAKIGKNRLFYYFLTEKGEELFEKKFGKKEGKVEIDISDILEIFSLVGWKCKTQDNQVFVSGNAGKKFKITLINNLDREKIYELVPGSTHFICANPVIKNILMQQLAKYCHKRGEGGTFFVALPENFKEKMEFQTVIFEK
jgi:DNA-binding MarR family transcriptional regulator